MTKIKYTELQTKDKLARYKIKKMLIHHINEKHVWYKYKLKNGSKLQKLQFEGTP